MTTTLNKENNPQTEREIDALIASFNNIYELNRQEALHWVKEYKRTYPAVLVRNLNTYRSLGSLDHAKQLHRQLVAMAYGLALLTADQHGHIQEFINDFSYKA